MKTLNKFRNSFSYILITFILLIAGNSAKAAWDINELYSMVSSGKPLILFPDSIFSQVNTKSFTIRVYQTQNQDGKDQQQVYFRNFVKLTNTNYFSLMGQVTLNGIAYHVYKFIDNSYSINTGYYAYINISESYYSMYGLGTFDRLKSCTDCDSRCASRVALYVRYELFYSKYAGNLPFADLDENTQEGIAKLMNWSLELTDNALDVSFWDDILDPANLGNVVPSAINCNNSGSICTCAVELMTTLTDIKSNADANNTDGTTYFSIINNAIGGLSVNSRTDCNCLSKYYPIKIEVADNINVAIFSPKEDRYPIFVLLYGWSDDTPIFEIQVVDKITDINDFINNLNFDEPNFTEQASSFKITSSNKGKHICAGETITLTAPEGENYLWSPGGGTEASINVSPENTTTYSVSFEPAWGCSASLAYTVNVDPLPTANAGADDSICSGNSKTLTAAGGDTYLWDNEATTASITISPETTTTYTVTVSSQNNCSATDDVTVYVDLTPAINLRPDTTICIGTSVTLVASDGKHYLWSTSDTTASIIKTPVTETTYTVTVTSKCGITSTDDITVTVNELPTWEPRDTITICVGVPTTLNAPEGDSYLWSTNQTTAQIIVSPTSNTMYTVKVYNEQGCFITDTINVVVMSRPIVEAGHDTSFCAGQSIKLGATGGPPYTWSTTAETDSITVSPQSTYMYKVSVTYTNNCMAYDSVTVIVKNNPTAEAGNDTTICKGDTALLKVSGGTTYLWSNATTASRIKVIPQTTTIYSVTASNNGCTGTDHVTVTVNNLPTTNAGSDSSICFGGSKTLTAITTGGISYHWNTGASTQSITVNPTSTTIYTDTVKDANNCKAYDAVTVIVNSLPHTDAGFNQSIISGDDIILTASAGTQYSYLWDNNETTQSITVAPTTATVYYVTITDANNCTASDDVTVLVGNSSMPYAENYWMKNDSIITPIALVKNVGIGTDNPTERLTVSGTVLVNGKLTTNRITSADSTLYIGDSCIAFDNNNEIIYGIHFPYVPPVNNGSINNGNGNTKSSWSYRGIGIGKYTSAKPAHSFAVGFNSHVTTSFSMSFGVGITNDKENSLMIGFNNFNNSTPSLFIGPAGGIVPIGNVGIGTAFPTDKLQIGEGSESISFGSALGDDAGNLEGYMGFNARRDRTLQVSNWSLSGLGESSGGAIIASDATGTIILIPLKGINGPSSLSDDQIKKRKVVSIVGGTMVGANLVDAYMKVNGKIWAKEIEVTLSNQVFPDYVFDKNYNLMPLSEIEKYINLHKHLPDIPSAEDVAKNGIALGENQTLLLKKIEELTLYIIELNKQIEDISLKLSKIDNTK